MSKQVVVTLGLTNVEVSLVSGCIKRRLEDEDLTLTELQTMEALLMKVQRGWVHSDGSPDILLVGNGRC